MSAAANTQPRLVSFSVEPVAPGTFEPFLLDVPALEGDDEGRAARRAYWQTFHLLGARGLDVDEYLVHEWLDDPISPANGRQVGPGGFVAEALS